MAKHPIFPFFFLISILFFSCEEVEVSEATPKCIETTILEIKRQEVRNPPAEVWQLTVDGTIYFYIPSYCCDIPSALYDTNCQVICSPDGGIMGGGSGNCPDIGTAEWELIWKDNREYQ